MIISLFAVSDATSKKVFRSTGQLSSSKINYYLTEFSSSDLGEEGVVHKDTYNYVYRGTGCFRIVAQVSKDTPYSEAVGILKHVAKNSSDDVYDMLVTFDNVLAGTDYLKLDLQEVKSLESQDEKIFNMMMENKMMEMRQREKEYRKQDILEKEIVSSVSEVKISKPMEVKPRKVEKSSKPVLIIIKERLKLEIDKENYIKENVVNGEICMVIYDQEYKHVQLKMSNLKGAIKFSPYLDKEALKKSILRFEKDRGINKSIPLLKWAGRSNGSPLAIDFWNDEEDGKYLNIFEFKAKRDLEDLEIRFSKKNVTDIEIDGDYEKDGDFIKYKIGNLSNGDSKTIEIRCLGLDSKCLFPVEASFKGHGVDTLIDVSSVLLEDKKVDDFEVRKNFEVESFVILNE